MGLVKETKVGLASDLASLENEYIQDIQAERLLLLCDYYGLKKTNIEAAKAFVRLAADFVPGMQVVVEPVRGRPNTWTELEYLRLWVAVQGGIKKGKSAKEVCARLVKADPWKSLISKKSSARTAADNLYEHYARSIVKSKVLRSIKLVTNKLNVPIGDALMIAELAEKVALKSLE